MSLLEIITRRLIIVTGKGGVGKSTLTAALGRALAAKGKRVLLAEIVSSAEMPSALSDALGGPQLVEEPMPFAPNLFGALLTPNMGHLRFLQDALPIRMLADAAMRSQALRKFLAAAPGFSDMGVMYRMLDLMRREHPTGGPLYEYCLIDSPATGHALALAQIPEFLTRVIPGGPIYRAAKEGLEVLTDAKVTGTLIVTLAETLPVTEALELKRGMEKHRLPVLSVVVNRVPNNPFSVEERVAVDALLKAQPAPVFGGRELMRIERAEAALQLLENSGVHFVQLAEVDGVPPKTSALLAARL
jgi:anion-transporting  ArsA/GET3 family ATPase